MKIKAKLNLSVGLLFTLILFLGFVSSRYILILKSDTDNVLAANYNSIEFTKNILQYIEVPVLKNLKIIDQNIQYQKNNITEIGEREMTQKLYDYFEDFKKNTQDSLAKIGVKTTVFQIMDLNMQAIQRKSRVAQTTADQAFFWIAITATFCFLIAFVLMVNLPSNIANPIAELTQSIQQIANKNYAERVHFEEHNEFGQLAQSFNQMAQKLQEYNNSSLAKIMLEKKRTETLINNMNDPIIGLDENLHCIFINEEALKILGLTNEETIGLSALEIALKNDLLRTLIHDIKDIGVNTGSKSDRLLKIYADRKESYFEKEVLNINITLTGEKKPKLIGYVILLRNITIYKELDLAKTNFIATVSHEFKTPIAAIKMGVQLLENAQIGVLNLDQQGLINGIKDDAERLLKITDELLNMTQIENGGVLLSLLPNSPENILAEAIQANRIQAEQKKIRITLESMNHLPKINVDRERTIWVLSNLIANAINYSYENSIITIFLRTQNTNIYIGIKDAGPGIPPQYITKIFDRYVRVPDTNKSGTGLGLAICKELIEAQHGHLEVDSTIGMGSVFTVVLPILP